MSGLHKDSAAHASSDDAAAKAAISITAEIISKAVRRPAELAAKSVATSSTEPKLASGSETEASVKPGETHSPAEANSKLAAEPAAGAPPGSKPSSEDQIVSAATEEPTSSKSVKRKHTPSLSADEAARSIASEAVTSAQNNAVDTAAQAQSGSLESTKQMDSSRKSGAGESKQVYKVQPEHSGRSAKKHAPKQPDTPPKSVGQRPQTSSATPKALAMAGGPRSWADAAAGRTGPQAGASSTHDETTGQAESGTHDEHEAHTAHQVNGSSQQSHTSRKRRNKSSGTTSKSQASHHEIC